MATMAPGARCASAPLDMTPNRPRTDGSSSNEPVFQLRSVRPARRSSAEWMTVEEEDLIETETLQILRPRWNARRTVVRLVGYLLIGALFWGMALLIARPPIREAILNWTTFGMTRNVLSAEKHFRDFVDRW